MRTLLLMTLLAVGCRAQSRVFDQQYARALQQNPPAVKLIIETVDGRTKYRLSEGIRVRLKFTSEKLKVFTIDTAPGGNVAVGSTDFVIDGPDMTTPVHSLTNPVAIACCGSRRKWLGRSPVQVPSQELNLRDVESHLPTPPFSSRVAFKPGEYVIFVQTRNVMRGWPKSLHDAFHVPSDIVVTSGNVLHLTILSDAP